LKGGHQKLLALFAVKKTPVPGANYKFMQVLGLGGVDKLFVENEIEVLRFWDGNRGCPALDA